MHSFQEFLLEYRIKKSGGSRHQSGKGLSVEKRAKKSVEQAARHAAQSGKFVRPVPGGYEVVDRKTKKVRVITPGRSSRYLVNRHKRDRTVGKHKKGPSVRSHKQYSRSVLRNRKRTRPEQSLPSRYKQKPKTRPNKPLSRGMAGSGRKLKRRK